MSSTAYDLGLLRGQLRSFIQGLGYEPVLSDFSDVLYDPRADAQSSCLRELQTCDMLVLVVGGRLGSEASAQTLECVDLEDASVAGMDIEAMTDGRNISITQAELITAVQNGIPAFTFVEQAVMTDYHTFHANRHAPFLADIQFGSISQPGTASYIFSFIELINNLVVNNAIQSFSRIEEVEDHLRRQWAALFQRLAGEAHNTQTQVAAFQEVASRLSDLEALLVSTVDEGAAREIARGTLEFRAMLAMLASLPGSLAISVDRGDSWPELLAELGIKKLVVVPEAEGRSFGPGNAAVILDDDQVWVSRGPSLDRYRSDWDEFRAFDLSVRKAIYSASTERRAGGIGYRPSKDLIVDLSGDLVQRPQSSEPPAYSPDEEPF